MPKTSISKIIYFDKETIGNILQERYRGNKQSYLEIMTSTQASGEIEVGSKINLNVPFFQRIGFLFSGKLESRFFVKRDSETTITSTEISEFDVLKSSLVKMEDVQLSDIENSSTSFRVAGNYLRIMKSQFEDVDVKAFNDVMNDFDGYDVYKFSSGRYVRFNNTAFVSNYKRNDLLSTQMTLYAIKVGDFSKDDFDFMKHINKMEKMFNGLGNNLTLADLDYVKEVNDSELTESTMHVADSMMKEVELYDVIYASIVNDKWV